MATANDILFGLGQALYTVEGGVSVLHATRLMNEHKIGALVVTDEGRMAGIFTERDVLCRIVAQQRSAAETRVEDAMTRQVICCEPDTDLDEVSAIMRNRRIRHVPVCGAGGPLKDYVN